MKFINYTTKCNKCLQCQNYMYVCRGADNFDKVEKCPEYEYDENAYVRQSRDETYMDNVTKLNEELNKSIEYKNQYKTKTYIYDSESNNLITICYTTEAPKVNESLIIYGDDDTFRKYHVSSRILGINSNTGDAVWNLYVREIN